MSDPSGRSGKIPLLVPDMPDAARLIPYLRRMDAARWYTNFGPLVTELEARLGALHGAAAQTLANATLGLELALAALGLRAGSRILVPAVTFVATAAAIVRSGHEPLLADVDETSWLLTPAMAREALGRAAFSAVLPVCAYGCPQDAAGWAQFRRDTGIPVVVDAAGAFGNQADLASIPFVFSLHATKSLGAGEGGFVVAAERAFLDAVRRLSNFGIDVANGEAMAGGTNAKLSEYHAAVALAALETWEQRRAARLELHRRYVTALGRLDGIVLQRRPLDAAYTTMPLLLPEGASALRIAASLARSGIETRRWYCPTLDRHPAFRECTRAGTLAVAARLNERLLGLPFFASLAAAQLQHICSSLADALHQH